MASTLIDRVQIYAASNGTGAITLGSAVPGYRGVEALTSGSTYSYAIGQDAAFEVGTCTYLASQNVLVRSPLYSSNGNAAIALYANAEIAFVVLAEDILSLANPSVSTSALAIETARALSAENYLAQKVASAVVGISSYATLAALQASAAVPPASQARVYNDPTAANNTVYINKTGAVGGYTVDSAFYAGLAGIVQPVADAAAASAAAAAASAATVAGQVATIATLSSILTNTTTYLGSQFPTNSTLTAGLAVIVGQVAIGGTEFEFDLNASAAGTVNVLLLSGGTNNNFTLISKTALTAVVGLNTFSLSIPVTAGQYLGYELPSSGGASVPFSSNGTGVGIAIFSAVSGTQQWQNINGAQFCGVFKSTTQIVSIDPSVASPPLNREISRPAVTYNVGFGVSAPSDWTFSSGWTFQQNSVTPPVGSSAYSVTARLTDESRFHDENRTLRFDYAPNAAGDVIAVGYARIDHGTLVVIDDAQHTLGFCTANSGNTGGDINTEWATAPTISSSVPLPALVANREYVLQLQKSGRVNTATLYDMQTGAVMSSITDGSNVGVVIPRSGYQFGSPYIAIVAGTPRPLRLTVSSSRTRPRVMVIGDSLCEEPYDAGVQFQQRWAQIVKNQLGGSLVIAGISGSYAREIPQLLINEVPAVVAGGWIIAAFGTNDENAGLGALQANYTQLDNYCTANGINLAVVILPPIPARQYDQIVTYLKALPNRIRKVRWDYALTQNNDGVTYNVANYTKADGSTDNTHFNAAGAALVAARTLIDIPELLDLA